MLLLLLPNLLSYGLSTMGLRVARVEAEVGIADVTVDVFGELVDVGMVGVALVVEVIVVEVGIVSCSCSDKGQKHVW